MHREVKQHVLEREEDSQFTTERPQHELLPCLSGVVKFDAWLRRAAGIRMQGLRNIDWPEAVLFDCDGVRIA